MVDVFDLLFGPEPTGRAQVRDYGRSAKAVSYSTLHQPWHHNLEIVVRQLWHHCVAVSHLHLLGPGSQSHLPGRRSLPRPVCDSSRLPHPQPNAHSSPSVRPPFLTFLSDAVPDGVGECCDDRVPLPFAVWVPASMSLSTGADAGRSLGSGASVSFAIVAELWTGGVVECDSLVCCWHDFASRLLLLWWKKWVRRTGPRGARSARLRKVERIEGVVNE